MLLDTLTDLTHAIAQGSLLVLPLMRMQPAAFRALRAEVADIVTTHEPHRDLTEFRARLTERGTWQVHTLYSPSGRLNDMAHDQKFFVADRRFNAPEQPQLARLFALFDGRLNAFNITHAPPGSRLMRHTDPVFFPAAPGPKAQAIEGKMVRVRLHLPLDSNADSYTQFATRRFALDEGLLYFLNTNVPHAAANDGVTSRFHCILDLWLDDWLFTKLFAPAPGDVDLAPLHRLSVVERADLLTRAELTTALAS